MFALWRISRIFDKLEPTFLITRRRAATRRRHQRKTPAYMLLASDHPPTHTHTHTLVDLCASYDEQFQQLVAAVAAAVAALMDRSTNCRSQIASWRLAPPRGCRNSKRCIRRRRRHRRRNPAPLASGNEILLVGWVVGLAWTETARGDRRPRAGKKAGRRRVRTACAAGRRSWARAANGRAVTARRSDERSDDVLTRRSCVVLRVAACRYLRR